MPSVTVASRLNAASSAVGEIAFLGDLLRMPTLPDIPEMSRLASVKKAAQHYHSPGTRSSKNASKFLGFRRFQGRLANCTMLRPSGVVRGAAFQAWPYTIS